MPAHKRPRAMAAARTDGAGELQVVFPVALCGGGVRAVAARLRCRPRFRRGSGSAMHALSSFINPVRTLRLT